MGVGKFFFTLEGSVEKGKSSKTSWRSRRRWGSGGAVEEGRVDPCIGDGGEVVVARLMHGGWCGIIIPRERGCAAINQIVVNRGGATVGMPIPVPDRASILLRTTIVAEHNN